jgi:hypothetical protein
VSLAGVLSKGHDGLREATARRRNFDVTETWKCSSPVDMLNDKELFVSSSHKAFTNNYNMISSY